MLGQLQVRKGRWVDEHWSLLLAGGLFVLTMLSRLPGLISARMFDVDESYLAAMGMTMGRGGQLYIDALDRKPPLLPWLYSLSERTLGTVDLRMLRWMLVVAVGLAGFAAAKIVLQLGGSRRGAAAAGGFLVLGTVAFLPASATHTAVQAGRNKALATHLLTLAAAGVLVGVAGMIKQPLFATLAPVGCVVWQRRPRSTGALCAALGLVIGVVASGFPFNLGRVWEWAWVQTSDFLDGQVGGWRILGVFAVVALVFLALHVPVLVAGWRQRTRMKHVDAVVWWWLVGGVIAIIPGFRFIFHYFQLLVPPLAVLAGWLLSTASRRTVLRAMAATGAIAVACTALAVLPVFDAGRVHPDLVTAIQERSGHDDRILVWGALPEVYWRAERLPAARFLSVGYLTGKWADRTNPPTDPEHSRPWERRWPIFDADLRAHPPAVIVDMTGSGLDGWTSYQPSHYSFGRILQRCYERDPDVEGFQMWHLRGAACVRDAASAPVG